MRTLKPKQLSLLYKVYEEGGNCSLMIAVMGLFSFDKPSVILTEAQLWAQVGEILGKEAVVDMVMPKPKGEVIVAGKCYTPGGSPLVSSEVSVTMGPVKKKLLVHGDRFWKSKTLWDFDATEAKPFTEMEVSWENAFGGEGFDANTSGKGFPTEKMKAGEEPWPLPNIEDPKEFIILPEDTPKPAAFLPAPIMTPDRMAKMGTFDRKWKKEKYPGFPQDMDWTYFNGTQPDQWWEGFFTGNEKFEISGMHPKKPKVGSILPEVAARVFITRKNSPKKTEELKTRLDTVWLFPESETGIVIFRAQANVKTDDAEDVADIMAGFEKMGQPKTGEHYDQTFKRWTHPEHAAVYQLKEEDLLAQNESVAASGLQQQIEEAVGIDGIYAKKSRIKAQKELDEAKKKVEEQFKGIEDQWKKYEIQMKELGLDVTKPDFKKPDLPDKIPPTPKKMSMDEMIAFATQDVDKVVAEKEAMVMAEKAKAEAQMKEKLGAIKKSYESSINSIKQDRNLAPHIPDEKLNFDFDELVKEGQAKKKKGGQFITADEITEKYKEQFKQLENFENIDPETKKLVLENDPDFEKNLKTAREKMEVPDVEKHAKIAQEDSKDTYKRYGHHYPPATPWDPDELKTLREKLLEGKARGESFAEWDLTGLDLSGLDLSGIDLNNAYLEGANLSNCNLVKANLTRTVLAKANLSGANLSGAKLRETNIGDANLTGVKIGAADLTGAIIEKSDCTGADFSGADFGGIDVDDLDMDSPILLASVSFANVKMTGANLSGVSAKSALFMEADISGANFSDASLEKATFIKTNLQNANFTGANLLKTTVVESNADGANFSNAIIEEAAMVKDTSLNGANFRKATVLRSNFRGTGLAGADFREAILDESDFSECDMKKANLDLADATRARFQKTDLTGATIAYANLTEGLLQKTILDDADLTGSNLFGAEFIKAKMNDNTNFTEANLTRSRLDEAQDEQW